MDVSPLTAGRVRNDLVGFAPLVGDVGLSEEIPSDIAAQDKESIAPHQMNPILQALNQRALYLAGRGLVVAAHRTRLLERFELVEQDFVEIPSVEGVPPIPQCS